MIKGTNADKVKATFCVSGKMRKIIRCMRRMNTYLTAEHCASMQESLPDELRQKQHMQTVPEKAVTNPYLFEKFAPEGQYRVGTTILTQTLALSFDAVSF
eukprot:1140629-Pelagomonas_calceolata.AAC.2